MSNRNRQAASNAPASTIPSGRRGGRDRPDRRPGSRPTLPSVPFAASNVPSSDSWVQVLMHDGERYVGRIVFTDADGGRVRVKYGAGFWDLRLAEIRNIAPSVDPRVALRAS